MTIPRHILQAVDQQLVMDAVRAPRSPGFLGAVEEAGTDDTPPSRTPPSRVRAAQALTTEGWDAYRPIAKGRGAEWLAPAYPNVHERTAALITLGMSPVEIARQQEPEANLTKAEAHEWLKAGGGSIQNWWVEQNLPPGLPPIRSWAVLRWLKNVKDRSAWGALLKERTGHGPGGVRTAYRYIDKIDEVQDEDLVRGSKTSVDDVFAHAAERVGEAWQRRMLQDHQVLNKLPKGWKLPEHVRMLDTPAKLAREGQDMRHCVGGYADAVKRGRSVILGVEVPDKCRSTAELTPKGKLLQHKGRFNTDPIEPCSSIMDEFVKELLLKSTPAQANPHTTLRMLAGLEPPASEYCIAVIDGNSPPRAAGQPGRSYGWGSYRKSTRHVTVGYDWLREQVAGPPSAIRSAALYVLGHEGEERVPGQCEPGYGRPSVETLRRSILSDPDIATGVTVDELFRRAVGSSAQPSMRARASEVIRDLEQEGLIEKGVVREERSGPSGSLREVDGYLLVAADDVLRDRMRDYYGFKSNYGGAAGVSEDHLIDAAVGRALGARHERASRILAKLVADGTLEHGTNYDGKPRYWKVVSDEELRDRVLQNYGIERGAKEQDLIRATHALPSQRPRVVRLLDALVAEGVLDKLTSEGETFYRHHFTDEELQKRMFTYGGTIEQLVTAAAGYRALPDLRQRAHDLVLTLVEKGVLEACGRAVYEEEPQHFRIKG